MATATAFQQGLLMSFRSARRRSTSAEISLPEQVRPAHQVVYGLDSDRRQWNQVLSVWARRKTTATAMASLVDSHWPSQAERSHMAKRGLSGHCSLRVVSPYPQAAPQTDSGCSLSWTAAACRTARASQHTRSTVSWGQLLSKRLVASAE